MDRGAWQATVHEAAKNQTQLKWLSMHMGLKIYLFYIPSHYWGLLLMLTIVLSPHLLSQYKS